jgi:hypothetical protein
MLNIAVVCGRLAAHSRRESLCWPGRPTHRYAEKQNLRVTFAARGGPAPKSPAGAGPPVPGVQSHEIRSAKSARLLARRARTSGLLAASQIASVCQWSVSVSGLPGLSEVAGVCRSAKCLGVEYIFCCQSHTVAPSDCCAHCAAGHRDLLRAQAGGGGGPRTRRPRGQIRRGLEWSGC